MQPPTVDPPVLARVESPRVRVSRGRAGRRLLVGAMGAIAMLPVLGLIEAVTVGRAPPPYDAWLAVAAATSAVAAAVMLIAALVDRGIVRAGPGTLEVTRDAVRVARRDGQGSAQLPRASVRAGVVLPEGAGVRAELRLANGRAVSAWLPSPREASALLDAVGVGAAQQRFPIELGSRWRRAMGWCATVGGTLWASAALLGPAGLALPFGVVAPLALGLSAAASYALMAVFRPPVFVVGREGVAISVSVWRYFVAYRDLAAVDDAPDGTVTFVYRDGRRRALYTSVDAAARRAAVLRIRDAMDAARASDGAASHGPRLELLERHGRTVPAWREALARLAARAAGYRDEALAREDVARVLADPQAPASRRIGAALALRAWDEPDASERIRVAADACAAEETRAALLRVLDDTLEDDAVAHAEREEQTRRRL